MFSRTEMVLGKVALEKLKKSRVAVFGAGGVGGFVIETLARSGVGALDIIDNDTISESNINRQILALHSTIGKSKVFLAEQRARDINPDIKITTYPIFYLPENSSSIDFTQYDYVVDAIDTVTAKIHIITTCKEKNIPVISAMGTGNKTDPTKLVVTDIYKTSVCPLAKVMRHELKKRGIESLKVVYSTENPVKADSDNTENNRIPGSTAFVPPVAGIIMAREVIKDLIS